MSVEHKKGDILEFTEDAVGHGANCQKVMGSGVALVLRNRYPEMYRKDAGDARSPMERLGSFSKVGLSTDVEPGKKVGYNIYSQLDFRGRAVGKMDLDYNALAKALVAVEEDMKYSGLTSIALPRIGAGLAGGNWAIILEIINNVFKNSPVKAVVYAL